MPVTARLADGTELRFPDSTDPAVIERTVKSMVGQTRSPSDPTSGMSTSQLFFAGAGKAFRDTAQGVGQLVGAVSRDDVATARKEDEPLMQRTPAKIGNFVGNAALTLPTMFIPGVNTVRGAALLGGAMGLAQPSTSTTETATNVGLGGLFGAGGQWLGNKIGTLLAGSRNAPAPQVASTQTVVSATPTATATGGGSAFGAVGPDPSAGVSQAVRALQARGQELGFRNTPGQVSGSRALQQMEARLESQPMTSGPFNALKQNNQTALNRIAAKSIGETSDTMDTATLQAAHDRIQGVYRLVANDKRAPIDPDVFLSRLQSVEADFEGLLPGPLMDNPLVKRLWSMAEKGEATQEQLQSLASKFGKASYNQMTSQGGDRQVGMALGQVKDLVDDLLESNLSGETLKKFSEARGQYRNLMQLTGRVGIINPSTGNISGPNLANLLQQKDRPGYLFGKNTSDLYDAARWAQAHKPIVGDSGTATRSMVASPTDFVLSLPFNVATNAYLSQPVQRAFGGYAFGLSPELGAMLRPRIGPAGAAYGAGLGLLANPEQ